MPHNILMSKIRCYNPNKSHSALKNSNYIIYIGTRPGVDLTDVKFDELTALALNEEDINPKDASSNAQYIHYIAKRQNSQGLFGNFDFNNITDVAHEVRNMTDAGVNIYRGIISLSEEDALELGYNHKETWVNYMNSVMNDVGERFGVPLTALKWCAAVHMEQGHPHCHYTFWRTDGKVMSSYIHISKQNEIREFLSGEMFKAERELLIPEKNKYRDSTVKAARTLLDNLDTANFKHIPERITQQQLQTLASDLIDLSSSLPGKGSLKYKFLPPACKELLDKVVDDIIQIPTVNKEYSAYMKAAADISKTYSGSDKHQVTNMNIADEDIRTRLCNSVLKSTAALSLLQQNFLSINEDNSQVNSVHLIDDEDPQMNSVHLSKEKIRDDIYCNKLEWTDDFKSVRKELYSLDKKNPNYINGLNHVMNKLINYHNQGNIPATYLLARIYNSRAYPVFDEETAAKLYKLSYQNFTNIYNQEHTSFVHGYLSYHLGKMNERGLGCEVDYNNAVNYYKECIDNNAYAQYALANIYLSEKTSPLTQELYEDALSLLKKSSDKNPYAAYKYAQQLEKPLYEEYRGTDNDIYSYYHAALNGFLIEEKNDSNLDGSVLYKIGKIYYEGKGCDKDTEKAYEYFIKAAEYENKHAYYALGKTCADKTGPHYDPVRAEEYYIKAYNAYNDSETGASHAPSYVKIAMADLYANPEHEKLYDINKAIKLYKDCVENDKDSFSMFRLGSIYLFGRGVTKDEALGLKYLNDAAAYGNEYAQNTIDFYNNMKSSMAISASFSLAYHFLNALSDRRSQNHLLRLHSKPTSKEARIDAYKKSKEHSSPDFEHE